MRSIDNEYREIVEPDKKKSIGLVVIDIHPVMRYGICNLIGTQPGFTVLGDAADRQAGLQLVKTQKPDVLLLDVEQDTPHSTCGLITDIVQETAQTRILVYAANFSETRVLEAIRRGVSGYVIKTSLPERLFEAIRVVAEGEAYLDPKIASLVMGRVGRLHERRSPNGRDLTRREQEVLSALASGKRNREIAEDLFISERTVKFHVRSMFNKLRAKNRTEVVKTAIENGLI